MAIDTVITSIRKMDHPGQGVVDARMPSAPTSKTEGRTKTNEWQRRDACRCRTDRRKGAARARPAPSGAPLPRSVHSSPARGPRRREFNNGSGAMGVGPGAGRVHRGVRGGLVMAVLLWLAHAAPGLVSNHDRTAAAPGQEAWCRVRPARVHCLRS